MLLYIEVCVKCQSMSKEIKVMNDKGMMGQTGLWW